MAFQSFVTQDFLSKFTPISSNIDSSSLISHLEATELLWTREITGRLLYDNLKAKFISQTLVNVNDIELVGYIKQHICYRAAFEALPFLNVRIVAKGPVKLTGEFSEAASLKDVQWLQSSLNSRALYFEQRIVDYLCLNSKLFPLYTVADDKTNIIPNGEKRYDSDIYLGNENADRDDRFPKGYFN